MAEEKVISPEVKPHTPTRAWDVGPPHSPSMTHRLRQKEEEGHDVFTLIKSHPETNPTPPRKKRQQKPEDWVQKQAEEFIEWVNGVLNPRRIKIENLWDLSDGVKLIKLLEELSHRQIHIPWPTPKIKIQKEENVKIAFEFMKDLGLRLDNVGATDIVDGNLKMLLSMSYQLHNHYNPSHATPFKTSLGMMATGDGIEGTEVGMNAQFSIYGRVPSECDPEIEIMSPDGSTVEFTQLFSDEMPTFAYKPTLPGEYTVSVTYSGQPISGSPYTVTHKPSKKTNCHVNNTGTEYVHINTQAEFTVDCSRANEGSLGIKIETPSGEELDYIEEEEEAFYRVQFTPKVVGGHTVTIMWNSVPVCLPFECLVFAPEQCIATGSGLMSAAVHQMQPAIFHIATTGAGPGGPSVEITSPSEDKVIPIVVPARKRGSGVYDVKYSPDTIGEHTIHVKWNDFDIPGSPFACQVCDPSQCVASGSGLSGSILGHPARFQVTTRGAGPGNLSVSLSGSPDPVALTALPDKDKVHVYEYTPQEMCLYMIDIKFSGHPIPGSPFTARPQEATRASKVFVTEMPKGRMRANKPVTVTVDAKAAEEATLAASVRGPLLQEECETTKVEDGVYDVTFVPKEVGEYTVEIMYGGSPIPDSPLHFTVNDPSKVQIDVGEISSMMYQMNKPVSFKVNTYLAGEGAITGTGRAPSQDFTCNVREEGDGMYTVSFNPVEYGSFFLDLYFDGEAFIGRPIPIQVDNLENIILMKPTPPTGFHLVNEPIDIRMIAPDRDPDAFEITALGKTGALPTTNIIPTGDDTYNIHFQASYPDDYKVEITYDKRQLPKSPFTLCVRQRPDPTKVMNFDPVIPFLAGRDPIELVFDTSQAGQGTLTAKAASSAQEWFFPNVRETSPNLYHISFIPRKNDTFTINVYWAGEPINGSPFYINFKEQTKEPPVTIVFDAEMGSRGMLSASAIGQNVGKVDVSVRQYKRNAYQIAFFPPRKDIYDIHVFKFNSEIRGSPFQINLTSPPPKPKEEIVSMETIPVQLQEKKGSLSACIKGHVSGLVPIRMSMSRSKDLVLIDFKDYVHDSYDLFMFWNHLLLEGAPFKLDLSSEI